MRFKIDRRPTDMSGTLRDAFPTQPEVHHAAETADRVTMVRRHDNLFETQEGDALSKDPFLTPDLKAGLYVLDQLQFPWELDGSTPTVIRPRWPTLETQKLNRNEVPVAEFASHPDRAATQAALYLAYQQTTGHEMGREVLQADTLKLAAESPTFKYSYPAARSELQPYFDGVTVPSPPPMYEEKIGEDQPDFSATVSAESLLRLRSDTYSQYKGHPVTADDAQQMLIDQSRALKIQTVPNAIVMIRPVGGETSDVFRADNAGSIKVSVGSYVRDYYGRDYFPSNYDVVCLSPDDYQPLGAFRIMNSPQE